MLLYDYFLANTHRKYRPWKEVIQGCSKDKNIKWNYIQIYVYFIYMLELNMKIFTLGHKVYFIWPALICEQVCACECACVYVAKDQTQRCARAKQAICHWTTLQTRKILVTVFQEFKIYFLFGGKKFLISKINLVTGGWKPTLLPWE